MTQGPSRENKIAGERSPFIPASGRQAGTVFFKGRKFVDFTSWDVFGINSSDRFRSLLIRGAETFGLVSPSARVHTGTSQAHIIFEQRFASYFGAESALLFSSRNQCVLSIVTALFSEGDVIFFEENGESPVADACALIGATSIPLNPGEVSLIEEELSRVKTVGRRAVFVESVSSITGRARDCDELSAACAKVGAGLFVDDTAGLGLYGPRGAVDLPSSPQPLSLELRYASLTHGLGMFGACVCGRSRLLGSIMDVSRSLSVEHPLPPFMAALAAEVLDYIELQIGLRERLRDSTSRVSRELCAVGFDAHGEGPVISIVFPSYKTAKAYQDALEGRGLLVDAMAAPFERRQRGVLRAIVRAEHHEASLAMLLDSVVEVRRRLSFC